MNKKILFLALIIGVLISPLIINGQGVDPCKMIKSIQGAVLKIAITIVIIGWSVAGILWLVTAGNPEKIGTAKKATVAAVIGTVVVILSDVAYGAIMGLLNLTGGPSGC